jgi:hypothetical protein
MPAVSEAMVQAAFDYLNDQADAASQARADLVLSEHRRKRVRAQLLRSAPTGTTDQRNAWAESHDDYWEACKQEAEAVKADNWHRHQKARAMAIIDAWRTLESTMRQTSRVG